MQIGPDRLARMTRIAALVRRYNLSHVRFRDGDQFIEMAMPSASPSKVTPLSIDSPTGGVVMLRHACQCAPLVGPGTIVGSGQTLAMIAKGPLFEVVRAPRGGKVVAVLKAHGSDVSLGEPLLQMA